MEGLYSKLYDKYNDLKKKKMTDMDQINKDQEIKFVNYVEVAEELVQHLKNENEKLHSQVDSSEVASTRVSKECSEYQKLWIEESQKNKMLSEEIERLQKLLQESTFTNQKGGEIRQASSSQMESEGMLRSKRRRLSAIESSETTHHDSHQVDAIQREQKKDLEKETMTSDALVTVQQPDCCKIIRSGDYAHDNNSVSCFFQALVQCLVGMKFSFMTTNEGLCVSAEHQSSGYSFSLTWLEEADGSDVELLYDVLSLGTFERVAPPWMKEAVIFSLTMCPVFFDRVSRVVKFA